MEYKKELSEINQLVVYVLIKERKIYLYNTTKTIPYYIASENKLKTISSYKKRTHPKKTRLDVNLCKTIVIHVKILCVFDINDNIRKHDKWSHLREVDRVRKACWTCVFHSVYVWIVTNLWFLVDCKFSWNGLSFSQTITTFLVFVFCFYIYSSFAPSSV
jgi:hypothetical protein